MHDLQSLSCFPHDALAIPRVKIECPNHFRYRCWWDGHTYRCPVCERDVGRYVYDVMHFTHPDLEWDDIILPPDFEDAMTWIGCSPEESKRITESLKGDA
jgi:hypothetical protein